jgi:hypothetical protein
MVWGGASQHHRTELVVIAGNLNAVRYREDILLPDVVPFLQAHQSIIYLHILSLLKINAVQSERTFIFLQQPVQDI